MTLVISELAAMKLRYAAQLMPKDEIGGFGRTVVNDGTVELRDIVIPPQEVGGAHVDISQPVLEAFYADVIRNGCGDGACQRQHPAPEKGECPLARCGGHRRGREARHDVNCYAGDVKDWRVWWHKHPGTGKPSPSSTDRETLQKFAAKDGFGFGWMIGLIISSDASEHFGWVDVTTGPWRLYQDDIDIEFEMPDDDSVLAVVKAQVEKVERKVVVPKGEIGGFARPKGKFQRPDGAMTDGQGRLLPATEEAKRASEEPLDFIGYDKNGKALFTGDEYELHYDRAGWPLSYQQWRSILRRQYNIPPAIDDEDVEDYVTGLEEVL
jgi:hypothetical protein